jgi:sulfur-oxidizing protein SoxX
LARPRTLLVAVVSVVAISGARAESLRPYAINGDAIAASLTGRAGDPQSGRAIVLNRRNTCLLCHRGPLSEASSQGNLGPDLTGTGARWSEGQLRLRMVDAARLNPQTIMPSFYRVDGLTRVAAPLVGQPILTAEQIEDVVAYLTTLRDPPKQAP